MKKIKFVSIISLILLLFAVNRNYAIETTVGKIADPAMHYTVSGYFTFANCMLLTNINENMKLGTKYTIGGVIGMIPGLLKESYDEYIEGNSWDWRDIGYNTAGVASGIILHYFIFDKPAIKKQSIGLDIRDKGFVATCTIRF